MLRLYGVLKACYSKNNKPFAFNAFWHLPLNPFSFDLWAVPFAFGAVEKKRDACFKHPAFWLLDNRPYPCFITVKQSINGFENALRQTGEPRNMQENALYCQATKEIELFSFVA